jgi:hypothetical protein
MVGYLGGELWSMSENVTTMVTHVTVPYQVETAVKEWHSLAWAQAHIINASILTTIIPSCFSPSSPPFFFGQVNSATSLYTCYTSIQTHTLEEPPKTLPRPCRQLNPHPSHSHTTPRETYCRVQRRHVDSSIFQQVCPPILGSPLISPAPLKSA